MLNIPTEILDQIFHLLTLKEILQLRRVHSKFRNAVDQMKFNEVSIFINQFPFYETAYLTNEPIDQMNSLVAKSFSFLNEPYFKTKFKSLKRLFVYVSSLLRLEVSWSESNLSHYENLEHFELHHVYSVKGDLELENLKVLSIDAISKCEFNLNCPNLTALNLDGEVECNLMAEHRLLRHLEQPAISSFHNFRQLTTLTIYKLNDPDLSWLADLKHLEELHIYSIRQSESLENLKEMKYNLNLNRLRILFGGIDIENEVLFGSICSVFQYLFSHSNEIVWSTNFLTNRLLRFYTRNTPHLVDLRFVEYLECEGNFDIPEVIIAKLFNLKTLYAYDQCFDDEKFKILIQNCKKIRHLQLSNLVLDQSQYDLIPVYLTNLRTFELKRCNLTSLDFVKLIKNIEFFGCSTEFSLNELKNIILNCRLLRIIKLKYEYDTFFIRLINLNFKYLEQVYQFNTFDDLIQHIDSCDSFKDLVCKCFSV